MKRFPKTINSAGKKIGVLDKSRILVAFKTAPDFKKLPAQIKDLGLKFETGDKLKKESPTVVINHNSKLFWLRSADDSNITEQQFARIEQAFDGAADWIGPVYGKTDKTDFQSHFCPRPTTVLIKKGVKNKGRETSKFKLKRHELKSKYLTAFDVYEVPDLKAANVFEMLEKMDISKNETLFEKIPMILDLCAVPNDTLFTNQWNMTRIQAPEAWDISTGSSSVVIAVIDTGVDLDHPDLAFAGNGIDLENMTGDGSPNDPDVSFALSLILDVEHGTCCAGIAAATFNNSLGVAGVAGNCLILPVAAKTFSDLEISNGINWAVANGANVISMSTTVDENSMTLTATELAAAAAAGVVMCVATSNFNRNQVQPLARDPHVMACGASNHSDNRKTFGDGDGAWGSNYGLEMSVVAPGVSIPTTDMTGSDGRSPGDFILDFRGTSSATPQVAGLAALLKSQYPALTAAQIRNCIERTADKTGTLPWTEAAGKPNGTWNQEMGYGRINAFHALDFADVLIKDWPGDDGIEPSTPANGNFWDFSDIVIRRFDDDFFDPTNIDESKNVERGQTNFIYVRVTNNGPRDARNVVVSVRITPCVGLQYVPADWTSTDATHIEPTTIVDTFASVPANGSVIAKFSLSEAQVEVLLGPPAGPPWHPCLLAKVTADNDYAFQTADLSSGNLVVLKNNLAQRNLSVVNLISNLRRTIFPFVIGSKFNKAKWLRLHIDKSKLPRKAKVLINIDDNGKAFPKIDFKPALKSKLEVKKTKNVKVITEKGVRFIEASDDKTTIDFSCQEKTVYPISVQIDFPKDLKKGEKYMLSVFQTDEKDRPIGGASVIYVVNNAIAPTGKLSENN